MYVRKVGRAYGRGCLVMLATAAVGAVLGTAMVVGVLLLIRGGDVERGSPRFLLALALPILLIAAVVAAAALWVWLRARRIDRAFAPLGLSGRQSGPVIRSWHGEIGGRAFDAWFTRGPTIDLYLGCRPATRGAIHRAGRWVRALTKAVSSREPLEPPPLGLEGATVYADDAEWMRRLLARPRARAAVEELLAETPRVAALVSFGPDAVRSVRRFLPLAEIRADNVERWLDPLARLAAEVDALGPSASGVEATRLETWARTERGRHLNRILLIFGLVLATVLGALYVFAVAFVGR